MTISKSYTNVASYNAESCRFYVENAPPYSDVDFKSTFFGFVISDMDESYSLQLQTLVIR